MLQDEEIDDDDRVGDEGDSGAKKRQNKKRDPRAAAEPEDDDSGENDEEEEEEAEEEEDDDDDDDGDGDGRGDGDEDSPDIGERINMDDDRTPKRKSFSPVQLLENAELSNVEANKVPRKGAENCPSGSLVPRAKTGEGKSIAKVSLSPNELVNKTDRANTRYAGERKEVYNKNK
jgi:hypothetical protein